MRRPSGRRQQLPEWAPNPYREFAIAYAATGSVTEAAEAIGYAPSAGRHILAEPETRVWIDRLRLASERHPGIATLQELQQRWTRIAQGLAADRDGQPPTVRDQLRASELLARSLGGFIDRTSVSVDGDLAGALKAARERAQRAQELRSALTTTEGAGSPSEDLL